MYFVALATALDALASGRAAQADVKRSESIPENDSGSLPSWRAARREAFLFWLRAVARFHEVRMGGKSQVAKVVITVGALCLLLLRIFVPDVKVDAISLGLFILAALPWLSELIKSADLPGGLGITFRDIKEAGDKVVESADPNEEEGESSAPDYSANNDPNLVLVGLRIDIERRLRRLATQRGLQGHQPLQALVEELRGLGMLNGSATQGLSKLIDAGNQAAHGAHVESAVKDWAVSNGPRILRVLEAKLEGPPSSPGRTLQGSPHAPS